MSLKYADRQTHRGTLRKGEHKFCYVEMSESLECHRQTTSFELSSLCIGDSISIFRFVLCVFLFTSGELNF